MKTENKSGGQKAVIYSIVIFIGFAVIFGVMLIFSVISVSADLNEDFATPLASLSLAAGGAVSGYSASKKIKRGGMVNGAVCGSVIFLVMLLISLIIDDGGITLNTLFNFIISELSAVIGGILGVGKRSKKII